MRQVGQLVFLSCSHLARWNLVERCQLEWRSPPQVLRNEGATKAEIVRVCRRGFPTGCCPVCSDHWTEISSEDHSKMCSKGIRALVGDQWKEFRNYGSVTIVLPKPGGIWVVLGACYLYTKVQICMWNSQHSQTSFGENVMSREVYRKSFNVERKIIEKLIFNCPEDIMCNHWRFGCGFKVFTCILIF